MELLEAIRTTRAMRRLDRDRPVGPENIWKILDAGNRAASGGNAQALRWIVVTDPDKRAALGQIYARCWAPVRAGYNDRRPTDPVAAERQSRMLRSADHLGEHMGDAPVIILPATGSDDPASVYPAVQNLMLAARELGLGTTLTTVHRQEEDEVRTVLEIPAEIRTWAMIPVGYPTGRWGEAVRRPIETVTFWDGWKITRPRVQTEAS